MFLIREMENEMNTDVSKLLKGQLDSVEIAVEEITALSSKVDELARELNEHGKLSIKQLSQFQSATGDTQKVLSGLLNNAEKFDDFIAVGSSVSSDIQNGVQSLSSAIAETTNSLNTVLERFGREVNSSLDYVRQTSSELQSNFAVSVGQLQGSLADSKRQLIESLEVLTVSVTETSSKTSTELSAASQELLSVAEQVRGKLLEVPSSVETRILERLEPSLDQFSSSISVGANAVTNATDSVVAQVSKVAQRSSEEIAILIEKHQTIIQQHNVVSSDLQSFLSNADDFVRMSKALEQNRALLVEIEKGLSARTAPIFDRLDYALCGAVLGWIVGYFAFGFSTAEVLTTLLGPVLLALYSQPIVKKIVRAFRGSSTGPWTPPVPPSS
jgi:ABC-type transporter Mla subunit MlaD